MSQRPSVVINFKDLPHDEALRAVIERDALHLADEFREVGRIEITLSEDAGHITAHGHVTGRKRDVGAQAEADEMRPAADQLIGRLERQLRTLHDKRLFTQRRDARRHPPKKRALS